MQLGSPRRLKTIYDTNLRNCLRRVAFPRPARQRGQPPVLAVRVDGGRPHPSLAPRDGRARLPPRRPDLAHALPPERIQLPLHRPRADRAPGAVAQPRRLPHGHGRRRGAAADGTGGGREPPHRRGDPPPGDGVRLRPHRAGGDPNAGPGVELQPGTHGRTVRADHGRPDPAAAAGGRADHRPPTGVAQAAAVAVAAVACASGSINRRGGSADTGSVPAGGSRAGTR